MPNPHFSDGKILTDPRKNWINQPTNVANVYLFWSSRSFSDSAHSAPLIFSLTILFFFFFPFFGVFLFVIIRVFFLANFLEELHGDYAKSFVDWFHFGALKDSGIHSEWFLKIHAQGPLGSQKKFCWSYPNWNRGIFKFFTILESWGFIFSQPDYLMQLLTRDRL